MEYLAAAAGSPEFVAWLPALDAWYGPNTKIPVVLDNHSVRTLQDTHVDPATRRNPIALFTAPRASWLNLREMFFAKLEKRRLRETRGASVAERQRLEQYLAWFDTDLVPFRWRMRPRSAEAPFWHTH